jgi:RNA polymerase sigma factor (sigma-70 family)
MKEDETMAKKSGSAVAKLVAYQSTGEGFDDVWAEIAPIVDDFARRSLRKLGVTAWNGDDDWAVGDVVSQTAERLLGLAAPDAGGRFDPAKAQPGLSGLRGWLWRVVRNQSVEWSRMYRGGRGVKILVESGFDLNDPPSGDEPSSLLDRQVAKLERPDLLPILESCIDQLPDALMRQVVRLKLHEEHSERQTASVLGVSVSRVHRRLQEAYALLRPMLEERGFDAGWMAA